jgi:hypothetical protein
MQLLVAIKIDDNCYCAQPIAANLGDRSAPPLIRTTFVTQLITSWQGFAQSRARKQRDLAEMNDSYTATSRLSLPERRMLDRSV